jgi:hypothetical protein
MDAVIKGLEGPSWHGRNYNALHDSMVTGSINGIEPPYEIIISGAASVSPEVDDAIRYFIERVTEWRARQGVEIAARIAD